MTGTQDRRTKLMQAKVIAQIAWRAFHELSWPGGVTEAQIADAIWQWHSTIGRLRLDDMLKASRVDLEGDVRAIVECVDII